MGLIAPGIGESSPAIMDPLPPGEGECSSLLLGRHRPEAMVPLLVEHGADLYAEDAHGATPLATAILANRVEAVQALLDAGTTVLAGDNNIVTAMGAAELEGHRDVVELLRTHMAGGDPDPDQRQDA